MEHLLTLMINSRILEAIRATFVILMRDFLVPKLPGCIRTHFIGTKLQWRVTEQAEAVWLFWTFFPVYIQWTEISLPLWPFFSFIIFNSCWSVSMVRIFLGGVDVDPPKPGLYDRGLYCMVQWTKPVHNKEDCSWVLDGVLDIRAQDGAFALCRLSMSIKQCAAFFFLYVQKHPRYKMLDDCVIWHVCVCV